MNDQKTTDTPEPRPKREAASAAIEAKLDALTTIVASLAKQVEAIAEQQIENTAVLYAALPETLVRLTPEDIQMLGAHAPKTKLRVLSNFGGVGASVRFPAGSEVEAGDARVQQNRRHIPVSLVGIERKGVQAHVRAFIDAHAKQVAAAAIAEQVARAKEEAEELRAAARDADARADKLAS